MPVREILRFRVAFFNADDDVVLAYPRMFEELSVEQIEAARAALAKPLHGSPNTSTKRVFNLDVSVIVDYTNTIQLLTLISGR